MTCLESRVRVWRVQMLQQGLCLGTRPTRLSSTLTVCRTQFALHPPSCHKRHDEQVELLHQSYGLLNTCGNARLVMKAVNECQLLITHIVHDIAFPLHNISAVACCPSQLLQHCIDGIALLHVELGYKQEGGAGGMAQRGGVYACVWLHSPWEEPHSSAQDQREQKLELCCNRAFVSQLESGSRAAYTRSDACGAGKGLLIYACHAMLSCTSLLA